MCRFRIGQSAGQEAEQPASFDGRQMERLDTTVISPKAEVYQPEIEVPRGSQADARVVDYEVPAGNSSARRRQSLARDEVCARS